MVYSLVWSPGDNLLLSASADGTAKVWHITGTAGAGAGSRGGGVDGDGFVGAGDAGGAGGREGGVGTIPLRSPTG